MVGKYQWIYSISKCVFHYFPSSIKLYSLIVHQRFNAQQLFRQEIVPCLKHRIIYNLRCTLERGIPNKSGFYVTTTWKHRTVSFYNKIYWWNTFTSLSQMHKPSLLREYLRSKWYSMYILHWSPLRESFISDAVIRNTGNTTSHKTCSILSSGVSVNIFMGIRTANVWY